MFGRGSAAAMVATLMTVVAGFTISASSANGQRGVQPVGEGARLKGLTSQQTVNSVGQAKRLAKAAGLTGQTITFITHTIPGRDAYVDLPPADPSPGDVFVAEATVFNASHSKRIGKAILHCELATGPVSDTGAGQEAPHGVCEHSISLDGRGALLLTEPFLGDLTSAVIGGTGDFKNVGGQGISYDLGPPDYELLFVVELAH